MQISETCPQRVEIPDAPNLEATTKLQYRNNNESISPTGHNKNRWMPVKIALLNRTQQIKSVAQEKPINTATMPTAINARCSARSLFNLLSKSTTTYNLTYFFISTNTSQRRFNARPATVEPSIPDKGEVSPSPTRSIEFAFLFIAASSAVARTDARCSLSGSL